MEEAICLLKFDEWVAISWVKLEADGRLVRRGRSRGVAGSLMEE